MKNILSLILAFALCFTLASCKNDGEEVKSNVSSETPTVSYLDIAKSKYIPIFNENEFQKRVYMDCDIVIGDITTKYTAAKSGNCRYVKYVNADETKVYLFDGVTAYLLDDENKTATVVPGIPSSYGNLLSAFDSKQLDRLYAMGEETVDGTEYTYETFFTQGGFCKYYFDKDNNIKYMHNWDTGTSDNAIFKITFNELYNEPDTAYFVVPEDYKVIDSQ